MRLQHDICWVPNFCCCQWFVCWLYFPIVIVGVFDVLFFYFMQLLTKCCCCCFFCCFFFCSYKHAWATGGVKSRGKVFFPDRCYFVGFVLFKFLFNRWRMHLYHYVTPCESSIRAQSLIQFSWKCKGMHENFQQISLCIVRLLHIYQ